MISSQTLLVAVAVQVMQVVSDGISERTSAKRVNDGLKSLLLLKDKKIHCIIISCITAIPIARTSLVFLESLQFFLHRTLCLQPSPNSLYTCSASSAIVLKNFVIPPPPSFNLTAQHCFGFLT